MRGGQVCPTQVRRFDRDGRQHMHSGDGLAPAVMTADDVVPVTAAGRWVLTENACSNARQTRPRAGSGGALPGKLK